MNALTAIVICVAAVVAACGLAALPLCILSWPQRVRWIVCSQPMGYAAVGVLPSMSLDLRQVTLTSVEETSDELVLDVIEEGECRAATITLATHRPSTDIAAMLREWCALRTPMIMLLDATGITLCGPTASIGDLHRVAREVTSPLG